jgi:hypothetical protein
MAITDERTFGGQTQVAPLRRVLVRAPEPVALARWREFGWLAAIELHRRKGNVVDEARATDLLEELKADPGLSA